MKGAALSLKASVAIIITTFGIAWGIAWAVNAYMFSQKQTRQETVKQIDSVAYKLNSVTTTLNIVCTKLSMLDSISNNQNGLRTDINKINKCVWKIARNQIKSTDTLINILEQLPPLFTQSKKNGRYQNLYTYPILPSAKLANTL